MKLELILSGVVVIVLITCQNNVKTQTITTPTAEQLYIEASNLVREMKYDSAMVLLRQAFEKGFEKPMKIIADSTFYYLVDKPNYRSETRKLLREFSIENHSTMVRIEEPGLPIFVKGKVLDESNNEPIENVLVELVHADSKGLYFDEKSMWNPRLFSYLKTDKNGEFSINTIQPGRYKDDDGNDVPVHIHFTLEAEGYRVYASEFTFENDPVFKANGNVDMVPVAILKNVDGQVQYQVTILLQRE